ncbi:MAG: hypothetical protein KGI29_07725 [Pseudomonadota bacterium]|nr:hypothetical protein [Pseudomonadota bacterium]MDE3037718.1 hypothetical protein [Pseudomonadota bacterium]
MDEVANRGRMPWARSREPWRTQICAVVNLWLDDVISDLQANNKLVDIKELVFERLSGEPKQEEQLREAVEDIEIATSTIRRCGAEKINSYDSRCAALRETLASKPQHRSCKIR